MLTRTNLINAALFINMIVANCLFVSAQTPMPSPSPTPTPITKTGVIVVNNQSTVGRISKWVASSNNGTGTIGDSVINESAIGTIGIGTNPFSDFKVAVDGGNSFGGVYGSSNSGNGLFGVSVSGIGVRGSSSSSIGVSGTSSSSTGVFGSGVIGVSGNGSGLGVGGTSNTGNGVAGSSNTGTGLIGFSNSGVGVFGQSTTGFAGRFDGNVQLNGNLNVTGVANLTATGLSGQITESQVTNLVSDLGTKANNSTVVHLNGLETITGNKSFAGTQFFNGNVGIGLVLPTASELLHVESNSGAIAGSFVNNSNTNSNDALVAIHTGLGNAFHARNTQIGGRAGFFENTHPNSPAPTLETLGVGSGPALKATNTGTGPAAVFTSGNVGIGTATPQVKLHVLTNGGGLAAQFEGNVSVLAAGGQSTDAATNSSLRLQPVSFANGIALAFGASNITETRASILAPGREIVSLDQSLLFFTGLANAPNQSYSDARLTILANGNVGIGTIIPGQKLHVAGNGTFEGNLTVNGNINALSLNANNLSNAGTLNASTNPIDWTELKNVPSSLAAGQVVNGLNGLSGNVNLAAGENVTISPSAGTLTISSTSPPAINPLQLATLHWYAASTNATFDVPGNNAGIAFDGSNLWVAHDSAGAGNQVSVVRPSDGTIIQTFAAGPPGSWPYGLAFDGANIWVAAERGGLTKLRASDGAVLGTYAAGNGPRRLAFDGSSLWVANWDGGTITKVRAVDGTIEGTFNVATNPHGVAFDGTDIWVTSESGVVTKLRKSDGSILGTYAVGCGANDLAFDGANMWIVTECGTVKKLRATDGTCINNACTTNVGTNPLLGVVFDGSSIWVTGRYDDVVTKIRASDGAILASVQSTTPYAIAFDGAFVWVTNSTIGKLSKY